MLVLLTTAMSFWCHLQKNVCHRLADAYARSCYNFVCCKLDWFHSQLLSCNIVQMVFYSHRTPKGLTLLRLIFVYLLITVRSSLPACCRCLLFFFHSPSSPSLFKKMAQLTIDNIMAETERRTNAKRTVKTENACMLY